MVWYVAMWYVPFTRGAIVVTLIFALLTFIALGRRNFRGGDATTVYSSVPMIVMTILWLGLTWRGIAFGLHWPHDDDLAPSVAHVGLLLLRGIAFGPHWAHGDELVPSIAHVGVLLARCALHTLLLGVLFAYPLGRLYPRLKWLLCFMTALGESSGLGPQLWGASASAWTQASVLLDLLGLAVGVPLLVHVAFAPRQRWTLAGKRAQLHAVPADATQGASLYRQALASAALETGWVSDDMEYFEFLRSRRPPRWDAIATQLRVDLTHAAPLGLVLGGVASVALGICMRWPAFIVLGLMLTGTYLWMLCMTLRTTIAAPVRFGVITSIHGRHPLGKDLVVVRAHCDDGLACQIVVSEALVGEFLNRDGAAIVAFLYSSRSEFSLTLAARKARPDSESAVS